MELANHPYSNRSKALRSAEVSFREYCHLGRARAGAPLAKRVASLLPEVRDSLRSKGYANEISLSPRRFAVVRSHSRSPLGENGVTGKNFVLFDQMKSR